MGKALVQGLAGAMVVLGGFVAFGFLGLNVVWLVRDRSALQEVLEGGENLFWLIVGMVPVVIGGLVCAGGVWLCRALNRAEAAP